MAYQSTAQPTQKRKAATSIVAPETATSIPLGLRVVRVIAFALVSSILLLATLPMWMPLEPIPIPSLAPAEYLLVARAAGFVAYSLLWLGMALGISITSKLARLWPGGPAAVGIHQYISLIGIGVTLLHVLSLLGNSSLGYSIGSALLPHLGSAYRPFWMGLAGKSGLYLMMIVGFSFYIRARLGHKAWRAIHALSFVAFLLALMHGVFAGTDTESYWVRGFYIGSMVILFALLVHRVWAARRARKITPTRNGSPARKSGSAQLETPTT